MGKSEVYNKIKQTIKTLHDPKAKLQFITSTRVMGYNAMQNAPEKKQIKFYKQTIIEFYDQFDEPNFKKKDIKKETDVEVLRSIAKVVIRWMINENKQYNKQDKFRLVK